MTDETESVSDQNRACNERSIAPAARDLLPHRCGSESDDESIPIPPRYWWLKRITIGVAALFVFLMALRLWWDWEANRRLQAEIDRIVAAGEPIFPEDFNPKVLIPDEENAAKQLLRAVMELADTPETNQYKRLMVEVMAVSGPSGGPQLAEIATMMEQNDSAFRSLRLARGCAASDFGVRWARPTSQTMMNMRPIRSGWMEGMGLMNLAIWAAVQKQAAGDHAAAIELFRDALTANRILLKEADVGQLHFSMELFEKSLFRALAEVVVALQLEPADPSAPTTHPATLDQLRQLRDELIDESQRTHQVRTTLHLVRMLDLDIHTVSRPPTLPVPTFYWTARGPQTWRTDVIKSIFSPLYEVHALHRVFQESRTANAVGAVSLRAALETIGSTDPFRLPHQSVLDGPPGQYDPYRTVVRFHFQTLAQRRIAAIAVALRLYSADHGQWPTSLSDLVPGYLPVVPLDPLAPDGRAMGYLPQCKSPIVYSLGPECVEQGDCSGTPYGKDPCSAGFFLDWTLWFNSWTRTSP